MPNKGWKGCMSLDPHLGMNSFCGSMCSGCSLLPSPHTPFDTVSGRMCDAGKCMQSMKDLYNPEVKKFQEIDMGVRALAERETQLEYKR